MAKKQRATTPPMMMVLVLIAFSSLGSGGAYDTVDYVVVVRVGMNKNKTIHSGLYFFEKASCLAPARSW
jgi:hypothetical protein